MNYLKYFNNNKYTLKDTNCWTFVQDVYEQEKGYRLPDSPVFKTFKEWGQYIKTNVKHVVVNKPFEGCLVHSSNGRREHVGYAISDKEYIHRKEVGILVSPIPQKAVICEVLHD